MHNLKGRMSAELETFSGTITLAKANDLPEGGSPRNENCDFSVGSVFTRQGLENDFTFAGNSVGPSPGGHAADTNLGGGIVWSNPSNVLTDTTNYATTLMTVGVQSVTMTSGGRYILNLHGGAPSVVFSGLGPGGAIGSPIMLPNGVGQWYVGGVNLEAQGVYTGPVTVTFVGGNGSGAGGTAVVASQLTDAIDVTQFGFSVASSVTPQGFIVNIKAKSDVPARLYAQMLRAGSPWGTSIIVGTMTSSIANYQGGGTNFLFQAPWTFADLNSTGFGIRITCAGSQVANISIGYITIQAYFAPSQQNFNYITTFEDDFGNIKNLAEDNSGEWWVEDITNTPGVFSPLFTGPPSGSFASSFTADSRQYMAISDLLQGNFPPQQYTGQWRDRVSQVGPGAAPSFQGTLSTGTQVQLTAYSYSPGILTLTGTNTLTAGEVITIIAPGGDPLAPISGTSFNVLGTGLSGSAFQIAETMVTGSGSTTAVATPQYTYPIVASPNGITQYPFWNVAQGFQSQLESILWSAGPGSSSSGNVITVYYLNAFTFPNGADANLVKAFQDQKFPVYVYVSGATTMPIANGTQLVTGIGIGVPPGGGDQRFYFTFNVASQGKQQTGSGHNSVPGQYRMTVATVKTILPLPGVATGDSITISGDPVPSWDSTWTVVNALNSGTYSISQVALSGGTVTYNWALAGSTATPPLVGQLVTVTTQNGDPTFNVTDAVIATVTGTASGTFTVNGFGVQTIAPQVVSGQAVTSGTVFQIDPGVLTFGTPSANPMYGNSGGGYITLVGSSSPIVGTGTRKGTVFFITRNGFWTAPAPSIQFTTPQNTNYILVSNIPIGPPNVIARGIAFTEAGSFGVPGASYYVIPTPVQYVFNGVTYLSSQTIINDNTTTTAKLTFTDAVLLDAEEIDIQGNNLFALGELGDSAWCTQYAGRSVWGRFRNKIQNFVNLSFDGGYNANPGGPLFPLGWGLDPNSNPANSPLTLLNSPVFGNSLYIHNQTGFTLGVLDLITQTAYQDWNHVPILQNQTPYSVRVTCRTPAGTTSGALVIDLTSYNAGSGYGQTYGAFTLNCSSMSSTMATFQGTLLTLTTLNIPPDLLLRVYASNLPNGGDIEVDRIEIFPTQAPTNLTDLIMSYKDDPESFDQVTGGQSTTTVNSQPANGAFTLHDQLYIVKESSLGYLTDSPNQEPAQWSPYKEVSNVAGACGINAFDVGEEWAVMACQNGLFLFNGGAPVPIQLENPDIWESINWQYGHTICVRNDVENRRILVSVPMITPNPQCPDFAPNFNPTKPNVILMINYEGIDTIEQLIGAEPLHVTMMGKLAVKDLRRKWSLWSIPCPYLGMIKRSELFSEMLFCNGNGSSKIYSLGSNKSGVDDGVPFISKYCTYGFVNEEKAEANPMFGLHNKRWVWYDFLISGNGTASATFFQNVLDAPYPYVVPGGIQLTDPAANDFAGPLDEFAMRMYVEVSTFGAANYFSLSSVILSGAADRWSPIRGF